MKSNSLATVLVKILGLSLMVPGITQITNGVVSYAWFSTYMLKTSQPNFVWQMLLSPGIYGIVYLGIGSFFLIKTPYVVQSVLKISPDE